MGGSDVKGGLQYVGGLIEGGDLGRIVRRLVVMSFEDVGVACGSGGEGRVGGIE
ncbi:AAA family ATPase [Staphylococcus saprophyticus]|uniref:AAA family ATPase n=1 Tax=Staphylococcus saprophyticus TaxID=29385 RepID=UPI0011A9C0A0